MWILDPAFYSNADPDPELASENNADQDPQPWVFMAYGIFQGANTDDQLQIIFNCLGRPTELSWPEVFSSPNFQVPVHFGSRLVHTE
jgi:hypothetical protein